MGGSSHGGSHGKPHKPPKKHGHGGGGGMGFGGAALGGKYSAPNSVSQPGAYAVPPSLAGAGILGGLLIADAIDDVFDGDFGDF